VLLGVDAGWFDNYKIIGTAPAVTSDRTDDSGLRLFSFPPIGPGKTANYELHVTSTVEGTTAPSVKVLMDVGSGSSVAGGSSGSGASGRGDRSSDADNDGGSSNGAGGTGSSAGGSSSGAGGTGSSSGGNSGGGSSGAGNDGGGSAIGGGAGSSGGGSGGSAGTGGSGGSGNVIGDAGKLSTFAPPARPGPVMSLEIPRLKLHSGVVQTEWEPPLFSVGQIKGTANITLGNTVLIGHLTGAAGNVFAHLDQLELGDEITAVSRGLPYKFVVSQTFDGPNTDATPMQPDDDAKLTLMTCAGVWNPITHDYSERLWVVAEPPDQAEVTIANAQATATAVTEATATEIAAHPTATPTPVPTPYAAEPSLPGGIGNTRTDLGKAFGAATGETSGKLVVFRPAATNAIRGATAQRPSPASAAWSEVHVRFSPDPPRARLLAVSFATPISFQAAVGESRKLFPTDTRPRVAAPEGNPEFVIERFTSPTLGQAIGETDFSVLYTKDKQGAITSIILGPGDDVDALLADAQR
jgi:LPXTG-site transpeptidase (sortase) family protein